MKKNTLYLECYSGISGDMTVAALLDLGADKDVLLDGLKSLNVDGYKIKISRKAKNSIDACDFDVILDESIDPHDHDHHYYDNHNHHEHDHHHHGDYEHHEHKHHDHDNDPHHNHDHNHHEHDLHNHGDHEHYDHDHNHNDDHEHHKHDLHNHGGHEHHNHDHIHYGHHEHRNLYDINQIIDNAQITVRAKDIAKKIFHIVAVAESKAHGKPIEDVHFHEVGAVDSIVDIVAAAICLDNLNIEDVIVSELYEGTGHITCQHGVLPIPVPAVVNIAAAHQLPLHITCVKGELITPTGAAIVAAIKTKDTLPKDFIINKIGLGAGKRNYERASFLRAMLIEDTTSNQTSEEHLIPNFTNSGNSSIANRAADDIIKQNYTVSSGNTTTDKVWILEANIDDCNGEALSLAMEILLENGAKDVYYTPIYMKKNRPAYMLGVLCSEDKIEEMEKIIFTHTTTIGIRRNECTRTTLQRGFITVSTPYGDITVKVCSYKDKTFYYPEYESIRTISLQSGQDYKTLYSIAQNLAVENATITKK